jgi:hypothetical protein
MALSPKRPRHGQPVHALPDDLLVDEILTRVPALTAVRCRLVCRAWRDALTSERFAHAHRAARAAAAHHPEIVFFAPARRTPAPPPSTPARFSTDRTLPANSRPRIACAASTWSCSPSHATGSLSSLIPAPPRSTTSATSPRARTSLCRRAQWRPTGA